MKRLSEKAFARLCLAPKAAPVPLERDVQAAVVELLQLRGAECVRVNGGAVKTETGFVRFNRVGKGKTCADLLVCYRGVFCAVECKRPGEKPTEKQAAFLAAINAAGGVGVTVWGVTDMADVLGRIDSGELP